MVRHTSRSSGTISSRPSCLSNISPRPERKNHISSTVRWVTAEEVWPGASWKWAIVPPARPSRIRTSDPSVATTSRAFGKCIDRNAVMSPPEFSRRVAPDGFAPERGRKRDEDESQQHERHAGEPDRAEALAEDQPRG